MTKTSLLPATNGQIDFELTIKTADIQAEYQKILSQYQQTAEIKGFRKGKAPIALVEKSIDKSQLYARILDNTFPHAYSEKITELKISPLIDPSIRPKQFEEGKDWVFEVTTVVKPAIELGDYKKYVKKALLEFEKNKGQASPAEASAKDGHEGHDHAGDAKLTVIFDTLLKEVKVEVAPLLVEHEAKSQLSRLVKQLDQLQITVADFAKSQKKTQEELIAEYRKTAETNLKLELILDKLVEVENPEITSEEIAKLQAPKGQEAYAKYVAQKQKILDNLGRL